MKRFASGFLGIAALVGTVIFLSTPRGVGGQSSAVRPGLSIDAIAQSVWIEEFDVSPDGLTIAFKSSQAGTYDIWTVPVAGGEPKQLTKLPGREMKPKYSPDGKWIVFEADHNGVMIHDIYIVPAQGGEPVRLTDNPLHDASPMWSPDSKKIFFTTQMFWDNSFAEIDIATKQIKRIAPSGGSPQLSPDGKTIAFTRNTKPDDDDQSNNDIYVMPVTGGEARLLTPNTFNALDSSPQWSPDGKTIAFISDRNGYSNVGVIDVASGEAKMLLTEPIEHSEPRWSPDGKWISFTKNLDYNYQIFKIPVQGGPAVQLTERAGVNGGSSATGQTRGMHLWTKKGDQILFHHSDPSMTGDVWIVPSNGGGARQITNHQHASLRDPNLFVWPEFIEYKSFDGLKVAGLVYKPKGSKPGDKLPALFFFRANSNGQHPIQWHPYIQYFVSRGYLVFAPNFRGSTGRGKTYRQAVFTRGGEDDLHDAFIGMDMLAGEGWVDPKRVGVFGGSTGGFFTNAAITKDPTRFKAAVAWYGDTDLVTMSSYDGLEGWNKFITGKTPMENAENYYKRSLVFNAARVKVPLLQLDAQGDQGGRFQQIEEYNVQAQIHGNWHDWVVYGKEPHGWYHWRPDSVNRSLTLMSEMFDNFILGEKHDVKARAKQQREGIKIARNPSVDLWNSLTNGRP